MIIKIGKSRFIVVNIYNGRPLALVQRPAYRGQGHRAGLRANGYRRRLNPVGDRFPAREEVG